MTLDVAWEPACFDEPELIDWRTGAVAACADCLPSWHERSLALGRCNGVPAFLAKGLGVEEDEDVDEHQAAGAAKSAAVYAARRETTSDLAEVSVAAPCGTCAHAAVCRIKATLDGWDEVSVRLPALDAALTVTLSAKVECSFYVRVKDAPRVATDPPRNNWTPEARAAQADRARTMNAARRAAREAVSS